MGDTITFYERQRIEFYLRLRYSKRKIARILKRDHTVIVREINRNIVKGGRYVAVIANTVAEKRTHKTNQRKLDKDKELKNYVVAKLKAGWSPEQISGRLKSSPAELHERTIHFESIYQYIYEGNGKFEGLYQYLRKSRNMRRRKQGRTKQQKSCIIGRISIHERPAMINEKKRIGDWESDTMVFKKQPQGLSVQYERKSMLVRINRVLNRSKDETEKAITTSIDSLPQYLWNSITFDNGGEGACHTVFRDAYDIKTYFCDPYKSWQKGGVENMNGLIRQYLPKNAAMSSISNERLRMIQGLLNNRPRKALQYATPNEVVAKEYHIALNS